jgi:16S rRNA G527 N7-methylase RsmG
VQQNHRSNGSQRHAFCPVQQLLPVTATLYSLCFVQLTCMDSIKKRVRFIEQAQQRLGLNNVVPLCGRAEVIGQEQTHREGYDVCVARAVAELPTLAELCLPLVKPGGFWMPAKGPSIKARSSQFSLRLPMFLHYHRSLL